MQENCEKEPLTRELFAEELTGCIAELLGDGYVIMRSSVCKNNGVLKEALVVRSETRECVPSFYLDEMYRSYKEGCPLVALAEHICEIVRKECDLGIKDVSKILTKEWFEERLFLRLINLEKNQDFLENAVYVRVLDMAAVFFVLTEQDEEGVKSFSLPKSAWEQAGLGTPEDYYDRILANTERLFPPQLMRLEETVYQCMVKNGMDPEEAKEQLETFRRECRPSLFYILTNNVRINGAGVLLYSNSLKQAGEILGEDFYILPSSVHEVLLLEKRYGEPEELNAMVELVNRTQVMPEEVLTDHVYLYEIETGTLAEA